MITLSDWQELGLTTYFYPRFSARTRFLSGDELQEFFNRFIITKANIIPSSYYLLKTPNFNPIGQFSTYEEALHVLTILRIGTTT